MVVDCDFQHSIIKCRKADSKKYGEQQMPYDVLAYEANDKNAMTSLMEKLHNDPSIDVAHNERAKNQSPCAPANGAAKGDRAGQHP